MSRKKPKRLTGKEEINRLVDGFGGTIKNKICMCEVCRKPNLKMLGKL